MPRFTISNTPAQFDMLFDLLSILDGDIRDQVEKLVNMLATN